MNRNTSGQAAAAQLENIIKGYRNIDLEDSEWQEQLRNIKAWGDTTASVQGDSLSRAQQRLLTEAANSDVLNYIDKLAEKAELLYEEQENDAIRTAGNEELESIITWLTTARNTWCHHPQGYTPTDEQYMLNVSPALSLFFTSYGTAYEEHATRMSLLTELDNRLMVLKSKNP